MAAAKARTPYDTVIACVFGALLCCGLALSLPGCGSPGSPSSTAHPTADELAVMVIESTPSDVKLFVDGAFYGEASRWLEGTVPMPAGARRIEIRAQGYYPHRRDVDLKPGHSYTLQVNLVPLLE